VYAQGWLPSLQAIRAQLDDLVFDVTGLDQFMTIRARQPATGACEHFAKLIFQCRF